MELRSISEEERVKSGLTRAKLGGLSKAEIMEMVKIIIHTVAHTCVLHTYIQSNVIVKKTLLNTKVETAIHNQKQKRAETGGEVIKSLDKRSRFCYCYC